MTANAPDRSSSRSGKKGSRSPSSTARERSPKRLKIDSPKATSSTAVPGTFLVSTRKSPLALYQTHLVIKLLNEATGNVPSSSRGSSPRASSSKTTAGGTGTEFKLLEESTLGDNVLNRHLADLGRDQPGLFTKELELHLLNKQAHFAVHSLKDMPTTLPKGLSLGCIAKRADERDCVVVAPKYRNMGIKTLKDLAKKKLELEGSSGSGVMVIGSSSLRRESLLRRDFSTAESDSAEELKIDIQTIRGNVQTRLRKLEEPKEGDPVYDCIILAKIGLERVNLGKKIEFVLETTNLKGGNEPELAGSPGSSNDANHLLYPYCVSQGALGIECRSDDIETKSLLKKIACIPSTIRCMSERSLLHTLEGGCQISMGVRSGFLAQGSRKLIGKDAGIRLESSNVENHAPLKISNGDKFFLEAILLTRDGSDEISGRVEAIIDERICNDLDYAWEFAEKTGKELAKMLFEKGALRFTGGGEKRSITYGSAETAGIVTEGFGKVGEHLD